MQKPSSPDLPRGADVCLVNMPVVALERPSLALGILKAAAARDGIAVRCLNPGFRFAERIGLDTYCLLSDTPPDQNLGDWLFAGVAFPGEAERHVGYLDHVDETLLASWLRVPRAELRPALNALRMAARRLVDDVAEEVLSTGARIVGCSSVFQQQGASLALLRVLKARDPDIRTVLGGANVEGEMGVTVHRAFDWVDVVVSGEADLLFAPLCRELLDTPMEHLAEAALPEGAMGPRHRAAPPPPRPPRARVEQMDDSPTPDFAEYFDRWSSSRLRPRIHPALPVETSRGCWWGQKHHCTFCGLNGGSLIYRSKSPERVLDELTVLTDRYQVHRLHVVDNILDRGHLETVVPALAERGGPWSIFYETKANLKAEELACLADAGVRRIQPGLESLHIEALRLMAKGTTPVINLQLLKRARHLGIFVTWNFLWEVPGDEPSWYGEVADWLPWVMHLQAPNTLAPIRFDRFSPYHVQPEAYGLALAPASVLRHIYPVDDDTLTGLAYYFEDHARPVEKLIRRGQPDARRFARAVRAWMASWGRVRAARPEAPEPPRLERTEPAPGVIEVVDTRAVAVTGEVRLQGAEAAVLAACDVAPSRSSLVRSVDLAPTEIDDALARLIQLGFVLPLDGRLLALPTLPPRSPYIPVTDYPGGWVERGVDPPFRTHASSVDDGIASATPP